MKQISSETQRFIQAHRNDDVRELALHAQKFRDVDIAFALSQIAGRQMAMKKLPEWAQVEGLVYPKHLSMEQCSSEVTARYKASLVEGDTLVDLTAGFGVDCAYMARNFRKADYVERQSYLCEQAVHNFSLLGRNHIQVHCGDAVEYLKRMSPVDCLYLDPARRDNYGRKTVEITDCEPNVLDLEHLLVEKAKKVVIKLSPMLDIFSALRALEYIREVHVVAVDNECKSC